MNGEGVAVVMPTTNVGQAVDAARRMIALAKHPLRMIIAHDTVRGGFVKTLNTVAAKINAEFITYVAQDSLAGAGWLKIAMTHLIDNEKSLFAFNDGVFNGTLAQFGVARMSFCEKYYGAGHVFYKEYHSHKADDELTLIAKSANQFSYSPHALMMEVDYRMQRPLHPEDKVLYANRKKEIQEIWTFD
jgi:hypothetical protein